MFLGFNEKIVPERHLLLSSKAHNNTIYSIQNCTEYVYTDNFSFINLEETNPEMRVVWLYD